jgi:uncharacterized membrane protein YqhA
MRMCAAVTHVPLFLFGVLQMCHCLLQSSTWFGGANLPPNLTWVLKALLSVDCLLIGNMMMMMSVDCLLYDTRFPG